MLTIGSPFLRKRSLGIKGGSACINYTQRGGGPEGFGAMRMSGPDVDLTPPPTTVHGPANDTTVNPPLLRRYSLDAKSKEEIGHRTRNFQSRS